MMKSVCVALVCLVALGVSSEVVMMNVDCGIDQCDQNFWKDSDACLCKPCTQCGENQFVKTQCVAGADTVCQACTEESTTKDMLVEVKCAATADTKFKPCTKCGEGQTQDVACEHKGTQDRTCKACQLCNTRNDGQKPCDEDKSCSKFRTATCTQEEDTKCETCKQCGDGQYETSPCKEEKDRECKDWTADCTGAQQDGTGTFESTKPSSTQDRVCTKCTVCEGKQYTKTACTATADATCATYRFAGPGKDDGGVWKGLQDESVLQKKKDVDDAANASDEDKAHVRCVSDNKGISICNPGPKVCGQKSSKDNAVKCTEEFVGGLSAFSKGNKQFTAGQRCKGACMDKDEQDFVTFKQAKAICEDLGMRLPKTAEDLKLAKGTGCNLNRKNIWYDL